MDHYPDYTNGRLDPQADALLTAIASAPPAPTAALTPEQARASFLRPSWLGSPREMAAVRDLSIPGPAGPLRLRAYLPHGRCPLPVLVFFHGGGFVVGSVEEFDTLCTLLADGAACVVVSVDYRLAPEWTFPAATEDAFAALCWVGAHAEELGGDPARIAVAGDSAGGNLAAGVALKARDEGGPALAHQVLVSPWVDLSCTETESFRSFGQGGWLSAASLRWYRDHYLPAPEQAHSPHASPILAPDLRGLPPALVLDSEFDILHDQVRAYALRLRQAGNAVDYRLHLGQLHDFVVLPGLFDRASIALAEMCDALRHAFRR